jgi:hypothetical protein
MVSAVLALGVGSVVWAQTPPAPASSSSQTHRDATYPNPSGQDSKPNATPPKQSQTPKPSTQPSSSPRDADPSQDNGAGKDPYAGNTGKKPNPSTGCSTPTDARSAQTQGNSPAGKPNSRDKSVCTTSGGDSGTKPKS